MLIVDLKREVAEKDKDLEAKKKEIEELKARNKELSGMLEIATRELREMKGIRKDEPGGE